MEKPSTKQFAGYKRKSVLINYELEESAIKERNALCESKTQAYTHTLSLGHTTFSILYCIAMISTTGASQADFIDKLELLTSQRYQVGQT